MDSRELNYYYRKFKFGENDLRSLMNYRVNKILEVSTFYDGFILEDDGQLSQQLINQFHKLYLSNIPEITNVPTGEEALSSIDKNEYDLIVTMLRIGDISPYDLSRKINKKLPDVPIILMLNDTTDISNFDKNSDDMKYFTNVFQWNGDAKLSLAVVKYIEDKNNIENDIKNDLVKVVLLVEDNINAYSTILPYLYDKLIDFTQQSIRDEMHTKEKNLRTNIRPRALMAHNLEDAVNLFDRFRDSIIGVITDTKFPDNGNMDKSAGIKLIEYIGESKKDIPILLMSSESDNRSYAENYGIPFMYKHPGMNFDILMQFITDKFGFGDFVFNDKNSNIIERASNLSEFVKAIETIPYDLLKYCLNDRDYLSLWFISHDELYIAREINKSDFSIFDSKSSIIDWFEKKSFNKSKGRILDYEQNLLDKENIIIRLAEGSIGGKGRGVAFLNALFSTLELENAFPGIDIKVPKTSIIGTDEYDYFIKYNGLRDVENEKSDKDVKKRFLNGDFSAVLQQRLKEFMDQVKYPIAIRSSGLLEDSKSRPFAGIYHTYMLANNDKDDNVRLKQLMNVIKLVYASIFLKNSKNYIENINFTVKDEKMAVVIQEIVGKRHDKYFYPQFSGVAGSYNFYPTSYIKHNDGFATIALGVGKYIVEGNKSFRFCPKYPKLDILQPEELYKVSQTSFYALKLDNCNFNLLVNDDVTLVELDIKEAEMHKTLDHIVSVWDVQNNRIVSGTSLNGPKIVNFADILKYNYFPLSDIVQHILSIGKTAMGVPVEIEFAVELNNHPESQPEFYILQIRPLAGSGKKISIDKQKLNMEELVVYTEESLGNGIIDNINDIIFVNPETFDNTKTIEIKDELNGLNRIMKDQKRNYILIGPGRWGTRDRFIGIPVNWEDISNARVIIETELSNLPLDSSQGTHFFHNVVTMNIGYFTILKSNNAFIDWKWLIKQKMVEKKSYITHIKVEKPFIVLMDGMNGVALIRK